jgi:hypothetical protein
MQHAKNIEVVANGIAMECHKNDIPKNSQNELKMGIRLGSSDQLVVHQDSFFKFDIQGLQGLAIVCIKICFVKVVLRDGSWIFNKTKA